jgi:hypothetical protein
VDPAFERFDLRPQIGPVAEDLAEADHLLIGGVADGGHAAVDP